MLCGGGSFADGDDGGIVFEEEEFHAGERWWFVGFICVDE